MESEIYRVLNTYNRELCMWWDALFGTPTQQLFSEVPCLNREVAYEMTSESSGLYSAVVTEMASRGSLATLNWLKVAFLGGYEKLVARIDEIDENECRDLMTLMEVGRDFLQICADKAGAMGADATTIFNVVGVYPRVGAVLTTVGSNLQGCQTGTKAEKHGDDEFVCNDNNEPQQEKTLRDLLPEQLRSVEAVAIFQRAIDAKMIEKKATGFRWMQIGTKGGKAQLAYFCGKFCGYKNEPLVSGYRGNVGNRVCYGVFEKLFNVNRLDRALAQCYAANKPQWWRDKIDALFH